MIIEFIVLLIGLAFGSFGNNVISYFTNGQKFDFGRSHCFCGEKKLKWFEILPLISYIFLKGKCSNCINNISFRYFIVELFSGVLAVLVYLKFQLSFTFFIYYLAFYIMLLIAVIDLIKFIIPNRLLVLLFFIAGLNLLFFPEQILQKVTSSLALALLFISVNFIYLKTNAVEAIGYGDIKYLAILLLLFTFPISLVGLWFSALIALPGFYLIKYFLSGFKYYSKIPFGTFISAGYFITVLAENWLSKTYNQIFLGIL